MISRVREGRSASRKAPVGGLLAELNVPLRSVAAALAIPERTMHRFKNAVIVPPSIADKVARVQDVLDRASVVLGSRDTARAWMVRPVMALGGETPLSLLDTSLGWEEVKQVLGRIEHGIPA